MSELKIWTGALTMGGDRDSMTVRGCKGTLVCWIELSWFLGHLSSCSSVLMMEWETEDEGIDA